MKGNAFYFLLLIIGRCFSSCAQSMLIIDTSFKDPYNYKNFILLAESVGFKPQVSPWYEVSRDGLSSYDCVMVIIDNAFLYDYIHYNADIVDLKPTFITQKILAILSVLHNKSPALVGVVLPSVHPHNGRLLSSIQKLCKDILFLDKETQESLANYLPQLLKPDGLKKYPYHTTLLVGNKTTDSLQNECGIQKKHDNYYRTALLPVFEHKSEPWAWYGMNNDKKFFVTTGQRIFFSEIEENFFYLPIDAKIYYQKLNELQEFLRELRLSLALKTLPINIPKKTIALPHELQQEYILEQKKRLTHLRNNQINEPWYQQILQEKLWGAWVDINSYKNDQLAGAKTILQAGFNLLWLQLTPELYLSTRGYKKNEKEQWIAKLKLFLQSLKSMQEKLNRPLPIVLAGMELTGNYENIKPENYTQDCYGREYDKIPCPLDFQNFWQKELLDVFDQLNKQWQSMNTGVPLGGIFLDLEMYHAKDQAANFSPIMDFSDYAWNLFAKNDKKLKKIKSVFERTAYLTESGSWQQYFDFLEQEMFKIGRKIRSHIKSKIPQAVVGVYNMTLSTSWFYKGLLAGLGTPYEPLLLATFNQHFFPHYEWHMNNNIHAVHMEACMLSKLDTVKNFKLIDELIPFHDGLWFNKVSRLQESRDQKDWVWDYGAEVTPLPTDVFTHELFKKSRLKPSCGQ